MKFQLSNYKRRIFILFGLLIMAGCKSKQTLGTEAKFEKNKTHNQVIEDVLNTQVKYQPISAKGNIEFKTGASGRKVPAVYKILKDSVLQVSVRAPMIGIEVFRVNITRDSLVIIDRLKKKYVADNVGMLWAIAGFNFYNLQDLLTNQLFHPGSKSMEKGLYDKFDVRSANEMYILATKSSSKSTFDFSVDATNHIKSALIRNEGMKLSLQWIYSDFIVDREKVYPTSLSAKINAMEKNIDLNISFSKLDIDNPNKLEIDLSIPTNYEKVLLRDILSSYMKKK